MKSEQTIFNTVATHLITQNARSVNKKTGDCKYRFRGKKCALGCLIPDELYKREMEGGTPEPGYGYSNAVTRKVFAKILGFETMKELDESGMPPFLTQLQRIHDKLDPPFWKGELVGLAKKHNLKIPKILK